MTRHVGDKITTGYTKCIILGLFLPAKLYTFAFEGVQQQAVTFFHLFIIFWSSTYG